MLAWQTSTLSTKMHTTKKTSSTLVCLAGSVRHTDLKLEKSGGIATSAPWGGVLTHYSTLGLHPKLKAEETAMGHHH